MTDLSVLKQAIKLVADAVTDTAKSASDPTSAAKALEYENLIPDILGLLPNIGQIPLEIKSIVAPADYAALLTELTNDLALPAGKTENIVAAALKLLSDIALVMVPDVEAVVAAAKS